MRKFISILTMLLCVFVSTKAQVDNRNDLRIGKDDSLVVSLLTCEPGSDAYKLFGHTAVRVKDVDVPFIDYVFNYGVFDFYMDNFIYKFVVGETDYLLMPEPTDFFFMRYSDEGLDVREQYLDLSPSDKYRLAMLIILNAQPDFCEYRYNFLYDNCSTRARDIIVSAMQNEKIVWAGKTTPESFRSSIHRFTNKSPWLAFGIDLVLGSEVDSERSEKELMYLPNVLFDVFESAYITDGVGKRPLVCATLEHKADVEKDTETKPFLTPDVAFWGIFLLILICTVLEMKKNRLFVAIDVLQLLFQGICGCLITFLFFFSEHPGVGTNWLVLLFNPLAFLMIVNVIRISKIGKPICKISCMNKPFDLFECVNLAVLLLVLALYFTPIQSFPSALIPLVLSLLLRSVYRTLHLQKSLHSTTTK